MKNKVTIYEPIGESIDIETYDSALRLGAEKRVEEVTVFSNINRNNSTFGIKVKTDGIIMPELIRDTIGRSYFISIYLFGMSGTKERLSLYKESLYKSVQRLYQSDFQIPTTMNSLRRRRRWRNLVDPIREELTVTAGRPNNFITLSIGEVLERHSYFHKLSKIGNCYLAFITCLDIPSLGGIVDRYIKEGGRRISISSDLGYEFQDDLALIRNLVMDRNKNYHKNIARETNLAYAYTFHFSASEVPSTVSSHVIHRVRCSQLLGEGYYGFLSGGPKKDSYIISSNKKLTYPNDSGSIDTEAVLATTECHPIHRLETLISFGE